MFCVMLRNAFLYNGYAMSSAPCLGSGASQPGKIRPKKSMSKKQSFKHRVDHPQGTPPLQPHVHSSHFLSWSLPSSIFCHVLHRHIGAEHKQKNLTKIMATSCHGSSRSPCGAGMVFVMVCFVVFLSCVDGDSFVYFVMRWSPNCHAPWSGLESFFSVDCNA